MRDGRATKLRIHDAALTLFVTKGVTETSVRDLAQAAGIAEGTLYRHYASKDDLVADLFASNYAAFARRLAELGRPIVGFRARLAALVAELFRFHDDNPTLFRFLLLVQHQALPRVHDGEDNPVSVLHSLVEQGIRDGEVTLTDAALGTAMILGLMLQPATAIVYGRLDAPLSRFTDTIANACWRALNPTEAPHG
ncbi:putative transcriptional regulator, TetR family [Magnetospirillum sp. LM-5]|uniref:TetR/AcrR family transcriptional regulator n=1 Tax=Magnetospirillum sp. LM-5 TaxID=2681466 RepID=UPI001383BDE2|nr:TetR/AcrR family transcriptional regulator [Magnetospirillum sp. LM-5]CAA7613722.1 putative transcriptional regulator, TetR family [Magnetospirillum sp. LM-5]